MKAGRCQCQQATRVDRCCNPKGEGTIGLSKHSSSDVWSCDANAEGVLVQAGGRVCGEKASIGGCKRGCPLFGCNRGAGHGYLGCSRNTFSLVFLPGPSRAWGSNIGIGWAEAETWLAWYSGGRRKELSYVGIFTIPPHLSLIGSGVFGSICSWVAIPFVDSSIVQWAVSIKLARGDWHRFIGCGLVGTGWLTLRHW